MNKVYSTPSVSSLVCHKSIFRLKYAILSETCNFLSINTLLKCAKFPRLFPFAITAQRRRHYAVKTVPLRRKARVISPQRERL